MSVRGEERSRKRYAVRDDEVCVPYKRKPIRLNRRVGAPAATEYHLRTFPVLFRMK